MNLARRLEIRSPAFGKWCAEFIHACRLSSLAAFSLPRRPILFHPHSRRTTGRRTPRPPTAPSRRRGRGLGLVLTAAKNEIHGQLVAVERVAEMGERSC